ncbi:MAG: hypothetical protein KQI62_13850 [Deltaproteobacteria bacterium]|nr:hypothetical protein [Deltaproteobacteria bacterium]
MKALRIALALLLSLSAGSAAAQPLQLFVTSDRCMACHNGLLTPDGRDVSIGTDWAASIMAHSAKDPYWQASVRRESVMHPKGSAAIQNECSACHMPMNRYQAKVQGGMGQVFANLPVNPAAPAPAPGLLLAWDSVSCSMCHQIEKTGLGTDASFTAGFVVNNTLPLGRRPAFGPFAVDRGRQRVMSSSGLLEPNQSEHVRQAALCATCHTLYTHALGPDGKSVGRLPEQVPYLEWKHSAYSSKQACQGCHMPAESEPMAITSVLGQKRHPFARHSFRGGNFFMLGLLEKYGPELGVSAPPKNLAASAGRTRAHLETKSARVKLSDASLKANRLEVRVHLSNLAGHKLPTAYPSRRVWLRLQVLDAQGREVFSSGALRPDGSIAGNDNDADPATYEPHYQVISDPGQVQIYESIMAGSEGQVTTGLIQAVRYLKDSRLLPEGFDKATAHPDVAVYGTACSDPDFTAGSDMVNYRVQVDSSRGPFTVQAELWYQPIGFRWAQNLNQVDSMETKRFGRYYQAEAGKSAMLLAKDTAQAR